MKLQNIEFIQRTIDRNSQKGFEKLINTRKAIISPEKVESTERIEKRIDHLVYNRNEPFDLAKERLIGNSDLMPINYLEIGFLVSKSVGRIHVKNENGSNMGFGTGFMISPNLLLTNNHVFEKAADAQNSLVEFNYQYDAKGNPMDTVLYALTPATFFYTNTDLDFSLVAVKPISINRQIPLSSFGFLKLFKESGKILVSEYVSIIQHPGGGLKQIAIRENKVLTAEKDGDFITYSTDTTQGSSGSPVFNDQWQVVALHHSGVPNKDANGNYLCKDGTIWRSGMDDSLIDWISNEGIRISSIMTDLNTNVGTNKYITELFNTPNTILNLETEKEITAVPSQQTQKTSNTGTMENKITVNIPVEITVGISSPTAPAVTAQDTINPVLSNPGNYVIEKAIDPDYSKRNGYDPNFVTANNFKIELSDLLKKEKDNLAPLLNPTPANANLLHYYNFSVALNKYRRLCTMTAVNIDGRSLNSIKRENTKWILDPRIDEKYQTGPSVYENNDLDRGHMVRRLDPVWGEHAEAANDDTFNFVNSTPQHKNLNQKTWLSLEEYILQGADQNNLKVSVFTGPVFSADDIPYRGVLLPLQFWKVAAMIKADGTPSVTGYMLKQPDDIENFRTTEGISEDGFGQFKTYQVPLQKIAKLTGLAFDSFNNYDPLKGVDFKETANLIEINSAADVKL